MCICGALMKDPEWWIKEQKRLQQATPSHSIATKSNRNSIAESSGNEAVIYPEINEIRRVLIDGGNIESLLFTDEEEKEKTKMLHNSVLNLPTFFMYDDVSDKILNCVDGVGVFNQAHPLNYSVDIHYFKEKNLS